MSVQSVQNKSLSNTSTKRSKSPSSTSSVRSRVSSGVYTSLPKDDEIYYTTPEFIYGGPFVPVEKPSPFLDTATPINLQLQGTFKKSFAYYTLKDRLPIILTKVIDYVSREGSKIKSANSASDDELQKYVAFVAKLKNDLVTNKNYEPFTVDTSEAKKWNEWIENLDNSKYFNNVWLFSECYVYRKLGEAGELSKSLKKFDPFEEQKKKAFTDNLEVMCVVAEKVVDMLPQSEKDKRKADFITLLKIALWSNKCDLSLAPATNVPTSTGSKTSNVSVATPCLTMDPFQMIIDLKDKILVDDSGKIADTIVTKAENMSKAVEAASKAPFKCKCSCHRLATVAGMKICNEPAPSTPLAQDSKASLAASQPPSPAAEATADEEPAPQIPCPAKLVVPQSVMFDIVCDNAGYELFADLCLGSFLISQKIVQKVRYHVKKMPWFVSDVTPKDFKFVIDSCCGATFHKEIRVEPKPAPAEGEDQTPALPRVIEAGPLKQLAEEWRAHVDQGTFLIMAEDYWTYPHPYNVMKKYDYNMYRKLQYAVGVLFKGDLNYRKLLGEKNWNPSIGFEASLQGFIPAPVIALRTIKSELVSGLPKGKWDALTKVDPKWMQTGDYGVIQFCPKAEALKVADRPCIDYCEKCFGTICSEHADI